MLRGIDMQYLKPVLIGYVAFVATFFVFAVIVRYRFKAAETRGAHIAVMEFRIPRDIN